MDEIRFTSLFDVEPQIEELEHALQPDVNLVTLIDNFEYTNTAELNKHWFGIRDYEYENITLSNDVSSEGGSHSMQLDYVKGSDSPAYAIFPTIKEGTRCKAIQLDIKGDGVATIYVNLYINAGNDTYNQYRATISDKFNTWTRYVIGIGSSNFAQQNTKVYLNDTALVNLQKITFGMSGGGGGTTSSIYVDNIKFAVNNPEGTSENPEYTFGFKKVTALV